MHRKIGGSRVGAALAAVAAAGLVWRSWPDWPSVLLAAALAGIWYCDGRRRRRAACFYWELARRDAMTQMKNRMAFEQDLEELNRGGERELLLFVMDLNKLKEANDACGHDVGDQLIQGAAQCIREVFGPVGECYRIGGDEFAAVLEGGAADPAELARELDRRAEDWARDRCCAISIARGWSRCRLRGGKGDDLEQCFRRADRSMFRDKRERCGGCPPYFYHFTGNDFYEVISCIVSAVDAKDPYTAAHSGRVREMAELLAFHMSLPRHYVELVGLAGTLHDVGKIGVPDSVLTKAGTLDAGEWEAIRRHPAAGWQIVVQCRRLREVAEIIRCHHERWDGSGYPDGLRGEEIPLGARIVALCDSIDAMRSDRVYRRALSEEACRREITRGLGVLYDPEIGRVVLDRWEEYMALFREETPEICP